MNDVQLTSICGQYIDIVWPTIAPLLEKGLKASQGEMDLDHIYTGVKTNEMQLWAIFVNGEVAMAGVTQVVHYPNYGVLRIICLGGGQMEEWKHMHRALGDWALSVGIERMEELGRPGWKKVLADEGWKLAYVVMVRDLHPDGQVH